MVLFTRTPLPGAPLGAPLRYDVAGSTQQTFDLLILDADTRATLGSRRFVGVASCSCDIAPLLRRAVRFVPSAGRTGFCEAADRSVRVVVEATGAADGTVAAPARTYPACTAAEAPALLTSMPRERLLAPGECDELTLLSDGAPTVAVTAVGPGSATLSRSYRAPAGGLHVLRIAADDFAGAERLEVDAGPCGRVGYTLLPAPEGARRLAWRTAEGSVEHYTFPIELRTVRTAEKRRGRGAEGHVATVTRCERRTVLRSACEGSEVLEALAGLLASPQVWLCGRDGYRAVDVLTSEAVVHRHGMPGTFDVEIRPTAQEQLPWN